ncbi:MAG: ribosome silencing factor [Bacteroidaceae bacterium]|nr:ribosome silencing factor [Bacteroidaceae bacterium]
MDKLEKEKNNLVDAIVLGLQEKKGKNIVVVDLTEIPDTICGYFVIATGGSPSQIQALARSVGDKALELAHQKPLAMDGLHYSQWVAMDYADVIVHILLPEERAFYDIEHLWADAELTRVPDLD